MLIRQPLTINSRDFIKTFAISLKSEYSDWTVEDVLDKLKDGIDIEYAIENHYYIVNQDNQKYSEAHDPIEFKDERIYTETDEKNEDEFTVEYPKWNGDNIDYKIGDKVSYNNALYKVLQSHTSKPDWKPNSTIGLFEEII